MIDKKDCIILNTLQKNCRTSLTNLAKETELSIDSVKKRVDKLLDKEIFHPRIQLRPRLLGFSHIVDVKIKLNTRSNEAFENLIKYLTKHPRVAELFKVSGPWDVSLVIISKDAADFGMISSKINNQFGDIIESWVESTTLHAYKFEEYNLFDILEAIESK